MIFYELPLKMDILSFTDVFPPQKTIQEAFTIQIKTATGRFHSIDVTPSMTVMELKRQIQKVEMYEPDQQRIIYSGKQSHILPAPSIPKHLAVKLIAC